MVNYKILDAWDAKYIRNLPGRDLLAWSDAEAVYRYPKWKWVYDKYTLHRYLDIVPTWDLWEDIPDKFPKFVKPRINVNGMGSKSGIVNSVFEIFDEGLCGTHIAQPVLTGSHMSTDVVFDDDKFVDYFSFICHYDNYGSFKLFESINKKPPQKLLQKMANIGEGRRVMNVESIGNNPLEIHLRPSTSFFDISGGLLRQLPGFIGGEPWRPVKQEKTYSRVYRTREDCRTTRPRPLPPNPRGVRSVQLCWEKGKRLGQHAQDPYSFRYMAINGSNIRAIEDHGRLLNKKIKFYT